MRTLVRICNTSVTYSHVQYMHTHSALTDACVGYSSDELKTVKESPFWFRFTNFHPTIMCSRYLFVTEENVLQKIDFFVNKVSRILGRQTGISIT